MQIAIERVKEMRPGLLAVVSVWLERVRARRELRRVDERSLRELGISPGLAHYEASRPFWQPLRNLRD
jgi:uncharacterized protein YjiS (DUF1127 family)